MRFVDTNVLLYALNLEGDKGLRARKVLEAADLALSVQVLQEFYTQAVRPSRMNADDAWSWVESFVLRYPVQPMSVELIRGAWTVSQAFQISFWDAAILEAARTMGCATVLTEDLNHGQNYGGVRVVNPFL